MGEGWGKMTRSPWGASRQVRVGLQVLTALPGGPSERQVYGYRGHWWQRGAEAMCRYEEYDHSTVTTLKFSSGALTLLRQGGIACRQVFRAGETGQALYRTPHGAWPIAWQCHALEMKLRENAAYLAWLRFSYDLELGGQHLGKYEVLVDVREDQYDGASDDMLQIDEGCRSALKGGLKHADRSASGGLERGFISCEGVFLLGCGGT